MVVRYAGSLLLAGHCTPLVADELNNTRWTNKINLSCVTLLFSTNHIQAFSQLPHHGYLLLPIWITAFEGCDANFFVLVENLYQEYSRAMEELRGLGALKYAGLSTVGSYFWQVYFHDFLYTWKKQTKELHNRLSRPKTWISTGLYWLGCNFRICGLVPTCFWKISLCNDVTVHTTNPRRL